MQLLRNGPRTFDAMVAAIDGARESVALESYMFFSDSVGERFARVLLDAARRGVHVRVIADWVGSREATSAFWRRLRAGGVEVRIFNRPGLHPWLGLIPRDHRKALVVDTQIAMTGGMGLAEVWSGMIAPRRRAPWRDTAVRIEGPAAVDMGRAFEMMWKRAGGTERRGVRRQRHLVRPSHGADVQWTPTSGSIVGIIEGEPLRLRVARALQLQAVSAERCIWIASAYFYPSLAELEALGGAALDGVDVRVLVPSRYDHAWMRRLTTRAYRRLIRNRVRVWEWNGAMMHAKTSVVDGRWVRVGSTDFNPLGVAINYELDAVIEDATLGAQAEAMFLDDLEHSREITMKNRKHHR